MEQSKLKADIILDFLENKLDRKEIGLDPNFWMEIGMKLNIALIELEEVIATKDQEVKKLKVIWLDSVDKKNVSEANLRIEAQDDAKKLRIYQSKKKIIEQFIQLDKKNSDRAAGW